MKPLETIVYVAEHQFFVGDESLLDEWDGSYWNDPYSDDGLGLAPGIVGVQCPRATGPAPVFLEMHGAPPVLPDARYCKVTEAPLSLESGHLRILGENNTAGLPGLQFEAPATKYMLRVLYADLDTVTYDDSDGAEHYLLQMYPLPSPLKTVESEKPIPDSETEGGTNEFTPSTLDYRTLRPYEDLDNPITEVQIERDVQRLHFLAQDKSPSIRCSSAVALARQKQLKAVQQMALYDDSRAVRMVAVGALALMQARDYLEMVSDREKGIIADTARMHLQNLDKR
tara:strand:+ start:243231 stop:244082 length:852 start_codon:yes stop_codon:yes gene_type:complete